jgi:hypothetical protein
MTSLLDQAAYSVAAPLRLLWRIVWRSCCGREGPKLAEMPGCCGVAAGRGGQSCCTTSALQRARLGFVLGDLNVDNLGVARTQIAEFIAYSTGIGRIIEPLVPLVIGRPPRIPAGIPAGDRFIGSGSKRDAVGHCAPLRCSSRRFRKFQRWFVTDLRVGAKNDTGAP